MKRILVSVLTVAVLGCGPTEPEVDWDAINLELDRIDRLLENCLEGENMYRHSVCYERAVRRIDELATKHGINLDE